MTRTLLSFPDHALWAMMSVAKSTMKKRSSRCLAIFKHAQVGKSVLPLRLL